KMAVPSENVMNTNLDDPITKAVVDNIMGNLPTKKPLVRCEDCDLSFTSQAVLDTHLQGARHAKQVRSKNIMATLEETKISFTKDEETNGLKCNVCNVCLNSIQQLQTHLNGSRHKKKLMRGNNKSYMTRCPALPAGKLPVSLRTTYLRCNICNKFFNSISQYNSFLRILKISKSGGFRFGSNRFEYRRNISREEKFTRSRMAKTCPVFGTAATETAFSLASKERDNDRRDMTTLRLREKRLSAHMAH
ncbi:hypothetical protein ALC62_13870, partial [Cyphomyrmex costatus]